MAREEQDRENLLAEATALVERVSIRLPGQETESVLGFRRDGGLAIYLHPQRVYQFTSIGQLRRAFLNDLLYKANQGHLVSLRRERGDDTVQLISRTQSDAETQAFLAEMQMHLTALQRALQAGEYEMLGQVPPDKDVLGRVATWMKDHVGAISLAQSPRAG